MKRLMILFAFMQVVIISCSMNTAVSNSDNSERILVSPRILFSDGAKPISPEHVAYIVVTVSCDGQTVQDTFDFNDHSGTLSSMIPTNTPFTLSIQAIDSSGQVIYYGQQTLNGAADDTTVTITANQVSPSIPELFSAANVDSTSVKLSWKDKSTNEAGFIIKRSAVNQSSFIVLDTVPADAAEDDLEEFLDNISAAPSTVYYYRIMAYNSIGVSDSITIKYDPLEVVPTPAKPSGDTEIFKDAVYLYNTDSLACGNRHLLLYRFDWGDGDTSSWSFSQAAFHAWTTEGAYNIRAQAKCSVQPEAISVWSEALAITVSAKK